MAAMGGWTSLREEKRCEMAALVAPMNQRGDP